jgi:polysaccharide pyruvyl transferase CsaB
VNRWRFRQVFGALGQSETLLFGGGGLFQDATSLRSCLYYWGLVRLARLRGAVPWALGQSVGPLSTRAGRFLTRNALKACRAVQVRDRASLSVCESLGFSAAEIGRDPVLSLGPLFKSKFNPKSSPKSKFLVNLRPCGGGLPERFAGGLAPFFKRGLAPFFKRGLAPVGLALLGVALAEEDERLMAGLIERGYLPPSMPIERVRSLDDAARVWSGAVGAAGMRLHFAVLSALAQVPLIAVPYDPKVASFAEAHGVPLWRERAWPEPRAASGFSASENESAKAQEELDAFCRKLLT